MVDTHTSSKLSALEQSGPRGYIRPLFFFPLQDESNDVLSLLEWALKLTKKAIPLLTAEMVPDMESRQKGRFNLQLNPDISVLVQKDLRGGLFPLNHKALKEQHFPAAAISQDIFCPVPVFPLHAPPIPVFATQTTSIDGGLILNVCIMHLVADAKAIYEMKTWAQQRSLVPSAKLSLQRTRTTSHLCVMMSSWFRIPFYDTQWGPVFGNGHYDRVRTVHEGFFNRLQVILPALPNKDMEVVIGLNQEHLERFERDEQWARYAS